MNNPGYYVGRTAPRSGSPWSIYTPGGHQLSLPCMPYWFATKKEALAYLNEHDLGAEIAEHERQEQEKAAALDRANRIRRHYLYVEWWAYQCAWKGIMREIDRLGKQAEKPELELIQASLLGIGADLGLVAEKARRLARQRYEEIEHDVDADIAREKAGTP